MLYGLNDICIIPTVISDIDSRSECDSYYIKNIDVAYRRCLPLFTAPMSCVINDKNWEIFENEGVNTIIPRNVDFVTRTKLSEKTFVTMSLAEFEEYFIKDKFDMEGKWYICIDLANGHMSKLIRLCKEAKEYYGDNLVLMTGNIANPETYLEYAKAGIDYIRIGIGSGNVCTTSANGGIHYPMASLIQECKFWKSNVESSFANDGKEMKQAALFSKEKKRVGRPPIIVHNEYKSIPKIVADGGFKNFDHIIKALALGADYCMLGEIFARTEEACGEIIDGYKRGNNFISRKSLLEEHPDIILDHWEEIRVLYRDYYGMSTKRAQMEIGVTDPEKLKTAEGIVKQVTIDYTLAGWVENFIHYLKSSMSYTGSKTLEEFKNSKTDIMSPHAFNAYYK